MLKKEEWLLYMTMSFRNNNSTVSKLIVSSVKTNLTVIIDYELFKIDTISCKSNNNNFSDWLWVCENRQWFLQKKNKINKNSDCLIWLWAFEVIITLVEIDCEFYNNQNDSRNWLWVISNWYTIL